MMSDMLMRKDILHPQNNPSHFRYALISSYRAETTNFRAFLANFGAKCQKSPTFRPPSYKKEKEFWHRSTSGLLCMDHVKD